MIDRIRRRIDLPRRIVWEALVDPALAEGWLDPDARLVDDLDDHDGGGDAVGTGHRTGRRTVVEEPELLESISPELGGVRIRLEDLPGGPRDRSTGIAVERVGATGDGATWFAFWSTRLDQLAELLQGRPVEWSTWERDHRSAFESYRLAALASH